LPSRRLQRASIANPPGRLHATVRRRRYTKYACHCATPHVRFRPLQAAEGGHD